MASFYNNYYHHYKPYFPTPRIPYKPNISTPQENKISKSDKSISSITKEEISNQKFQEDEKIKSDTNTKENEKNTRSFSFGPISFKNPFFEDLENPVFEIFGIQLYLDDIIILGLLFFLYQEGVQDQMLYIALILLLIG